MPVVVASVAFAVLFVRRPATLLSAEFYAEDGQVFFLGTFFGDLIGALARPYNGYLHVVPRVVAMIERLVPIAWAPLVGNLLALAIVAAIAAFLASARMEFVLPDRRARWLAAAGFVLLPTSHESLGSITFIQSYLVILIVAIALTRPPARASAQIVEAAALGACALSTPLAPLLLLLFIIRVCRFRRPALPSAATILLAGAAQSLVIVQAGSPGSGSLDPLTFAQAAVLRLAIEPVWGAVWTAFAISSGVPAIVGLLAAALTLLLLGVVLTSFDRIVAVELVVVAVAAGLLGIIRSGAFTGAATDPLIIERYFVPAAWVFVVATSGGLFAPTRTVRLAATALAGMLVAGVVADFRLPPHPVMGWAAQSSCIGGPDPCVVSVFPEDTFSIRWPGPEGPYDQGDWVQQGRRGGPGGEVQARPLTIEGFPTPQGLVPSLR